MIATQQQHHHHPSPKYEAQTPEKHQHNFLVLAIATLWTLWIWVLAHIPDHLQQKKSPDKNNNEVNKKKTETLPQKSYFIF